MKLQCLADCMGFVWVHADSFLRCVASPFHSFVTIVAVLGCCPAVPAWCVICRVHPLAPVRVDTGEPSPSYLASVRSWLRRLQSCWVLPRRYSLRLLLLHLAALGLCTGALWLMPAWVWRDM